MPDSNGVLPPHPRISVVIITRNEGAQLRATVTNFLETLPRGRHEILVVDDGSTDGSTAFLEETAEVTRVVSEGVGVARARNLGAAQASGDVILFADAHIRAPQGWHDAIVNALRREGVGAVAPGIYSLTEPQRRGFGLNLTGPDLHARWRTRQGLEPYPVPILPGCFLAMRRETFVRTAGFDSGMRQLGGNDNELSCRFWLLGYELLVVPEIEVGHLFRETAPYEAKWVALVHNRLRMAFVHFESSRVERVLHALRAYEAFPPAMAMMLDTDVLARRAMLAASRRFNDSWYFEKFALEC